MKFISLHLVLLFIIVSNSQNSHSNHYIAQAQQIQFDLIKYSKAIDTIISQTNQNTVGVVVIGNPDSGKSTLINYLANTPLKIIKDPDGEKYYYQTVNQESSIKIGNPNNLQPKAPTLLKDSEGYIYIESPGFLESEDSVNDIINKLLAKKVMNSIKRKKIIFVVQQAEIMYNKGLLLRQNKQMKGIRHLIGDNFEKIILVASKADNFNYSNRIRSILQESCQKRQFQTYDDNICKKQRVFSFFKPTISEYIESQTNQHLQVAERSDRLAILKALKETQGINFDLFTINFQGKQAYVIRALKQSVENTIAKYLKYIKQIIITRIKKQTDEVLRQFQIRLKDQFSRYSTQSNSNKYLILEFLSLANLLSKNYKDYNQIEQTLKQAIKLLSLFQDLFKGISVSIEQKQPELVSLEISSQIYVLIQQLKKQTDEVINSSLKQKIRKQKWNRIKSLLSFPLFLILIVAYFNVEKKQDKLIIRIIIGVVVYLFEDHLIEWIVWLVWLVRE